VGGSTGGEVVYTQPVTALPEVVAAEAPATPLPASVDDSASIDLVLEDVRAGEPATLVAGPSYRVRFRNQGLQNCPHFRVAVLASLDGQSSNSRALVDVPALSAGEAREVTLRVPGSAMKLVSRTRTSPTAFTHLIVSLDPDSELPESDETNNGATIERRLIER
jgi:hypothetical protein